MRMKRDMIAAGVCTNKRSGFTFIELLMALLIISVLAAVVGISFGHIPGKARMAAARDQLGRFKVAVEMYYSDNGNYPTQEQGLNALCAKPTSAPVPAQYPESGYLDSLQTPKDPWGNEYAYMVPGRGGKAYEIVTYGKDGEQGGEGEAADISSLEL